MKSNLTGVIDALSPAAVGSFNTLEPEMAQAVLEAAEEQNIPVIIGVATRHYRAIRTPLLAPALVRAIEQASVPAALHLDHAAPDELNLIREALDLGFTSIMIDGSRLPFEENVEITARVVEMARPYGAGVEGELGGIAGEEGVADTDDDTPELLPYTDAAEASRFVAQTGVDALAIAVGTAHGIYKQTPHISNETIEKVAAAVNVPLVMHGATGVSDAAIQAAVRGGIRKINYFSGLLQSAMDHVRDGSRRQDNDYLGFRQGMAERWRQLAGEQMRLYALR